MPFLGDSRNPSGPGILPAQDHRDLETGGRAQIVAVRIIDTRVDEGIRRHVHEKDLAGDVHGTSVWELDDRTTSPRNTPMWRSSWPSEIDSFGDGDTEDTPPPDSFPDFTPGGDGVTPQVTTPGPGSDFGTPGAVERNRNDPGAYGAGAGAYHGPGSGSGGTQFTPPPKLPGAWGTK